MSRYDWDETKESINARVHGVTFVEAEEALFSPFALEEADIDHSDRDSRIKVTAWSSRGRLLVVIVSLSGPRPRIISARRAMKRERHEYEARR